MNSEAEKRVIVGLSFSEPTYKRMNLVEELGDAGETLGRKFVEKILVLVLNKDPSAIVRHEAAFSLGRLHRTAQPLTCPSVEALCQAALNDRSHVVRHEATEVLGSIPGSAVQRTLKRLLNDPDEDVVETAHISLARHDEGE